MGIEAIKTKEELAAAIYGFRASRIILTAFEFEIFSKLGDKALDAAQLAAASGTDPRACERLLNALCVLGLLKKQGGRFRNAKISRVHLVAGRPHFLAGLTHSASQWQSWHTLSEAVRRGTSVTGRGAGRSDEKRRRGFIAAMHERASTQAPLLVKMLDLSRVRRCLDIGAGSGAHAMALARAGKSIRVSAFDLPDILPLTREYVRQGRLLERIDFVAGDFNRGGFGSGFDLVLLSAIVHMNDEKQNRRLVARAAAALNRGGQLVVQDFIMAPDRIRPAVGAVFALNMLVATACGDSYTAAEIGGWMRAAGLTSIVKKNTPFEAALMIGRKP